MNLEQRIRRLEDRDAIRTLIGRYGRLVDERDIQGVGMLFTKNGSFRSVDGKIASTGRDAVIEQFHKRYAVLGPSNHFTHDIVIDLDDADPDSASGWVNSHAEVVRNGVALWAALRYHDQYRREDGVWRFQVRELHFFYYVSPKDYPELLGQLMRNRAYTEPLPADYPENSATWKAYYAKYPQPD
jgi:hypothetical protein